MELLRYYISESSQTEQLIHVQDVLTLVHLNEEVVKVNNNTDMTYEIMLAEKARSGSREAFCELYGIYKDKLYRYALYRLGDPDDAEDAVSECILEAWKGIRSLRSSSSFGAWIFRILYNCCMKHIRNAIGLRGSLESMAAASRREQSSAGTSDLPLMIELAEALSQLSEDEREIVLLSSAAGLTSSEISVITGLSSGSVRSKLSRSMAKMRKYLS